MFDFLYSYKVNLISMKKKSVIIYIITFSLIKQRVIYVLMKKISCKKATHVLCLRLDKDNKDLCLFFIKVVIVEWILAICFYLIHFLFSFLRIVLIVRGDTFFIVVYKENFEINEENQFDIYEWTCSPMIMMDKRNHLSLLLVGKCF
jgi:hypothetical protein